MQIDVMLCDYAQVSGDKLFISGANIDRMSFAAGAAAPYVVNFAARGSFGCRGTSPTRSMR